MDKVNKSNTTDVFLMKVLHPDLVDRSTSSPLGATDYVIVWLPGDQTEDVNLERIHFFEADEAQQKHSVVAVMAIEAHCRKLGIEVSRLDIIKSVEDMHAAVRAMPAQRDANRDSRLPASLIG